MLEVNSHWTWSDFDHFIAKYGPDTNPDAFAKFITVGSYYDSIGTLLKNKIITPKMIPKVLAIAILEFWKDVGPIASLLAQILEDPDAFENIEYFFQTIKK